MRRLLLVGVVSLSSCVVMNNHYYTQQHRTHIETEIHAVTETTNNEQKPATVTVVEKSQVMEPQVVIKRPCAVFTLPERKEIPPTPDITPLQDQLEIDKVLTTYIKSLKRFIREERSEVDAHYTQYKKKCSP